MAGGWVKRNVSPEPSRQGEGEAVRLILTFQTETLFECVFLPLYAPESAL